MHSQEPSGLVREFHVGDTLELAGRQYELTDAGWRRLSRIDGTRQPLTPREARLFQRARLAAK